MNNFCVVKDGETALHRAMQQVSISHNLDIVQILIQAGADLTIKNRVSCELNLISKYWYIDIESL